MKCLLVVVPGLAILLLCSALSVDASSPCSWSYLELRESLDVSDSVLERSLSLLFLFLRPVWLFRTTNMKCCVRDTVHVAVLATGLSLRSFRRLRFLASRKLFTKKKKQVDFLCVRVSITCNVTVHVHVLWLVFTRVLIRCRHTADRHTQTTHTAQTHHISIPSVVVFLMIHDNMYILICVCTCT